MTMRHGLPAWLRPMRRSDREIRETERLWEILRAAEVCRVAFCSENWPYIVPMSFGCCEEKLYFHCATEGTKLDLLRANANVCFEVEANVQTVPGARACDWSVKYQSVIGLGRATLINDVEEKRVAMKALLAQYAEGVLAQTADGTADQTARGDLAPSAAHTSDAAPAISSDVVLFRIDILSLTGKESTGD